MSRNLEKVVSDISQKAFWKIGQKVDDPFLKSVEKAIRDAYKHGYEDATKIAKDEKEDQRDSIFNLTRLRDELEQDLEKVHLELVEKDKTIEEKEKEIRSLERRIKTLSKVKGGNK